MSLPHSGRSSGKRNPPARPTMATPSATTNRRWIATVKNETSAAPRLVTAQMPATLTTRHSTTGQRRRHHSPAQHSSPTARSIVVRPRSTPWSKLTAAMASARATATRKKTTSTNQSRAVRRAGRRASG
ncbi:hypothetical protein Psuf_088430 [Phytohabitans suffuscus]|uniref:Uncharacterized protein n=1 Tax=Phytohabitans suffuscus TaxID=624315 RepID=A0A6F8YZB9_9ACTN|nr:hypothetical protein Psuf_088430 [Phytohabitans suffuscus]